MLIRDIYGGDYTNLNLPADLIASSFGKAASLNSGKLGGKLCRGFKWVVSKLFVDFVEKT